MTRTPRTRRLALAAGATLLLGGCSSALLSPPKPPPALYALDSGPEGLPPGTTASATGGIALLVDLPRAAPGHDTALMAYVRRPPQLEYYASHQWVAPPSQMLAPLLVRALQASGGFRAVTQSPSAALSQWRLETSGLQLWQDYTGSGASRVHMSLRAVLLDAGSRRVLATRELQAQAEAPRDDPAGGVLAARAATQDLLRQLRGFCEQVPQSRG